MIDRPSLWLIYLLAYSNTERALHGSRRRFDFNGLVSMGFNEKDRILMENVYIFIGYGAKT